jgi:hypothetical protein
LLIFFFAKKIKRYSKKVYRTGAESPSDTPPCSEYVCQPSYGRKHNIYWWCTSEYTLRNDFNVAHNWTSSLTTVNLWLGLWLGKHSIGPSFSIANCVYLLKQTLDSLCERYPVRRPCYWFVYMWWKLLSANK